MIKKWAYLGMVRETFKKMSYIVNSKSCFSNNEISLILSFLRTSFCCIMLLKFNLLNSFHSFWISNHFIHFPRINQTFRIQIRKVTQFKRTAKFHSSKLADLQFILFIYWQIRRGKYLAVLYSIQHFVIVIQKFCKPISIA